jgi:hypothetical protein
MEWKGGWMAKFTGFMCDSCGKAENGNDRPDEWLGVMLPVNGNGIRESRDLCSDKCLLKFARDRNGGSTYVRPTKAKIEGLSEFLDSRGVRPAAKGAHSAAHARQRHEMDGGREDCLVCEFLTMKGEG